MGILGEKIRGGMTPIILVGVYSALSKTLMCFLSKFS